MAVFENLRNFIRQGKQAAHPEAESKVQPKQTKKPRSSTSTTHLTPSASVGSSLSPQVSKVKRYDDAIKRIIAEEDISRRHMPQYDELPQYEILEKMGDGAFSVVYKGVDRKSKDLVAIKVVSKANITASQRASVLKEAAIMRQLDHDNIARLLAFIETQNYYFIILELVSGGEVFHQIVRLTYFSEDLSRHVIIQVANAVRYLHEVAGVVHRDIKPENLLYRPIDFVPSKKKNLRPSDDDSKEDEGEFIPGVGAGGIGVIKLADFGLSKVIWNSKTMTPCGTVGYTAPEIVKDERYSKSVDMWALGCVLYTILCGFPPFYDESIEVLTHKVAKGQYTFLSPWWDDISVSAKDLVSKLLTVDPEKRFSIDEFLQHPWITQDGTVPVVESTEVTSHVLKSEPSGGHIRHRDPAMGSAMRDAIDISTAIHRDNIRNTPRKQKHMEGLVEEEESDENKDEEAEQTSTSHIEDVSAGLHNMSLDSKSPQVHSTRSRHRDHDRVSRAMPAEPRFFDLHLEGATLLERRRKASLQPAVGV